MRKIFVILFGCYFGLSAMTTGVMAQTSPTISMTVGNEQVSPGDSVTFNIVYRNNDENALEEGVVSLDLPLQNGLSYKTSSSPIELKGSKPFWRLPSVLESGSEGVLSLTVLVGSAYESSAISVTTSIDGKVDGSAVSSVSNQIAVTVAADDEESEGKDKNKDENTKEEEEGDQVNDTDEEDVDMTELQVDSIERLDVENIVGVLDLPQTNVNAWDSRYLIIGAAAFILILSAGIIAFFLGRKSK